MGKFRDPVILLGAVVLISFVACSPIDTKTMQTVLDKVSHAQEAELPALLYGYSKSSAGAQKVLLTMLQPLRAPSKDQHMSVEAVHQSGRFTLIVARVPWRRGSQPGGLQPIIICGETGHEQIVGYVLPFDDIIHNFAGPDMGSITQLSQWWIQNYARRN
jgi:hypothetical protein